MKNKRGFTLVELVVAIAILGVITLIALPTISNIQTNNKTTKYETYEKSIKAAAKVYTDGLEEDLFGATNSGCAIIKYSDLKTKDLIEDFQEKGIKCDKDEETFVFVMKSKDDNHHYYSNIVCHNSNSIVYSHKEDNRTECGLEDGNPPELDIIFNPTKTTYNIGDNPKARIKITDKGVGLRENQKVKYTWYKNGVAATSTNTLEFKNKNYQGSASKYIEMPSDLESINEPTDYTLKVMTDDETGKICDIDLNCTKVDKSKPLNYFVGAVLIKYKAGGASMIDPHGAAYSVNSSNDYIVRNGNDYIISKINYKKTSDLYNYNNKDYINIRKPHYHLDDKKEWKWNSKVFSQQESLSASSFGYSDEDIKKANKTVEVVANWKINTYKLTYDDNAGTGCSNKGVSKDYNQKWNSNCTPTRTGYTFNGWEIDGKIVQPATISSSVATKNINAKANWTQNIVTIYFYANNGTIDKNTTHGSIYSIKNDLIYMNNKVLTYTIGYGQKLDKDGLPNNNNHDWLTLKKDNYHTDSATAWNTKADGSGKSFDQTSQYEASDFCDASKSNCEAKLYANWKINTYTVQLSKDSNIKKLYIDNKEVESKTVNVNTEVTISCIIEDYYHFTGWKSGETNISDLATYKFKVTNNISLKATSQYNKIILNYYANGGVLQCGPKQVCCNLIKKCQKGATCPVDPPKPNSCKGTTGLVYVSDDGDSASSEGWAPKGLRDYAEKDKGTIYMVHEKIKGYKCTPTKKWHVGTKDGDTVINEATTFPVAKDLIKACGKTYLDKFKKNDISVNLYAGWECKKV